MMVGKRKLLLLSASQIQGGPWLSFQALHPGGRTCGLLTSFPWLFEGPWSCGTLNDGHAWLSQESQCLLPSPHRNGGSSSESITTCLTDASVCCCSSSGKGPALPIIKLWLLLLVHPLHVWYLDWEASFWYVLYSWKGGAVWGCLRGFDSSPFLHPDATSLNGGKHWMRPLCFMPRSLLFLWTGNGGENWLGGHPLWKSTLSPSLSQEGLMDIPKWVFPATYISHTSAVAWSWLPLASWPSSSPWRPGLLVNSVCDKCQPNVLWCSCGCPWGRYGPAVTFY